MNANLRNFALWFIIVMLLLALFTLFQSPGQRSGQGVDGFPNAREVAPILETAPPARGTRRKA